MHYIITWYIHHSNNTCTTSLPGISITVTTHALPHYLVYPSAFSHALLTTDRVCSFLVNEYKYNTVMSMAVSSHAECIPTASLLTIRSMHEISTEASCIYTYGVIPHPYPSEETRDQRSNWVIEK